MLFSSSSREVTILSVFAAAILLLAPLLIIRIAQAQTVTVASATSPADAQLVGSNYVGTGFVTNAGGPYDNLVLNLYSDAATTMPYAVGTGYLLTEEYTGDPAGLSGATPGYIDSVAASGNYYTFSLAATLQASTMYFFSQNVTPEAGTGYLDRVPGPVYYIGNSSANYDSLGQYQLTFNLTGTPSGSTATPEPESAALFLLTCLPFAYGIVRRRTTVKAPRVTSIP